MALVEVELWGPMLCSKTFLVMLTISCIGNIAFTVIINYFLMSSNAKDGLLTFHNALYSGDISGGLLLAPIIVSMLSCVLQSHSMAGVVQSGEAHIPRKSSVEASRLRWMLTQSAGLRTVSIALILTVVLGALVATPLRLAIGDAKWEVWPSVAFATLYYFCVQVLVNVLNVPAALYNASLPPGDERISCCSPKGRSMCCFNCACVLAVLAVSVVTSGPLFWQTAIRSEFMLDSTTKSQFAGFEEALPSSLHKVSIYLFNLTNADEVLLGEKPNVTELGPFVYFKGWKRSNFSWEADGDILNYQEMMYYEFSPELSYGPENLRIVTFNGAFQGVTMTNAPVAASLWPAETSDLDCLVTVTDVKGLVFGYHIPQMDILHQLAPQTVPPAMPGLINNGSSSRNRIHTGLHTPDKYGYLTHRFGMEDVKLCSNRGFPATPCPDNGTESQLWPSDNAAQVNGSSGERFPFGVTSDSKLKLWVDAFYRTMTLHHVGDVIIKGVSLLRFQPTPEMWQDATKNSANAAYYQNAGDGLLNLSSSAHGPPVFLSQPHFFGASPHFNKAIDGLTVPNERDHAFEVDIEPFTGTAMGGAGRVQINWKLSPLGKRFPKLKPVLLPTSWIEDGGSLDEKSAKQFTSSVGFGLMFISVAPWVLAGLALFAAAVGGCFSVRSKNARQVMAMDARASLNQP